jgi:hypothetical protein
MTIRYQHGKLPVHPFSAPESYSSGKEKNVEKFSYGGVQPLSFGVDFPNFEENDPRIRRRDRTD